MQQIKNWLCILISFLLWGSGAFLGASNTTIWDLLGTHIEIGLAKGEIFSSSHTFAHWWEVQQALKQQISYPLLPALDGAMTASARAVVLNEYVTTSRSFLWEAQRYLDIENGHLASYTAKIQECEAPIAQYNADFALAMQQGDGIFSRKVAQKIAQGRACIAENGVYYREHLWYRDSMVASQTALQKRVAYLMANEEKIIKYYDMLKPQLLQELYEVSRVLEVNYGA